MGEYSKEMSSNATRNIFKGLNDFNSLSKGIAENQDSNYNKEEVSFIKETVEIETLLCDLNKMPKIINNDVRLKVISK
jgi:hypothetical protein